MAYKPVSFYGPSQGIMTPARRAYQEDPRRLMAQQLMQTGSSTAPVQSPLEGIARALQAGVGGYFGGQAKRDMEEREAAQADAMMKALGGAQAQPWVDPDTGKAVGSAGGLPGFIAAGQATGNRDIMPALQQAQMQQMAREQELADLAGQRTYQERQGEKQFGRQKELAGIKAEMGMRQALEKMIAEDELARRRDAEKATAKPWLEMGMQPPAQGGGETAGGQSLAQAQAQRAAEKAEAAAVGKTRGEERSALIAAESALPRLEAAVDDLKELGKTATYTTAGQVRDVISKETGFGATEGAVARSKYIAHVKNNVLPLLRDTFGAAFTAAEGNSLLATLGDPDMAPAEKNAVLDAFIADKRADLEVKRRKVGVDATAPAAQQAGAQQPNVPPPPPGFVVN